MSRDDNDDENISRQTTTNELPETKGEKWINFSVFNIVIFDFDKIDLIL